MIASAVVPRVVTRASVGGVVALAAVVAVLLVGVFPAFGTGSDERMYREATLRWVAGGPFYLPHQFAGPYVATLGDVLYPPVALVAFVPLSFLPAPVWYLAPAAAVAWSLYRLRPSAWAWAVLVVLAALPWTLGFWVLGNPKILAVGVAFVLAALGWRAWVAAAVALVVLSVPFGSLWGDWLVVMRNARSMEYQWATACLIALPAVAWLGRRRGPPTTP